MFADLDFAMPEINYAYVASGLAAFGTALQNYQAVALSLADLASGTISASRCLDWSIQISALSAGGLCSGVVNFGMNLELLEGFFKRMNIKGGYNYNPEWDLWKKMQYFGGISVFVVTGILFGLMAFTFAMTGPLAILSVAVGLFVSAIMTIQEVETWIMSYAENQEVLPASIGKTIGHIIAIANVVALSLLFTLSLAQGLIAMQVAAIPALIAGFLVAFSFGAFTEYFFYNTYLANFCHNFNENLNSLMSKPNAWFALLCVSVNGLVNVALSYAGIEILAGLLIVSGLSLPPVAVVTSIAAVLAIFAGAASFILGLDFMDRLLSKSAVASLDDSQNKLDKQEELSHPHASGATVVDACNKNLEAKPQSTFATSSLIMFSPQKSQQQLPQALKDDLNNIKNHSTLRKVA